MVPDAGSARSPSLTPPSSNTRTTSGMSVLSASVGIHRPGPPHCRSTRPAAFRAGSRCCVRVRPIEPGIAAIREQDQRRSPTLEREEAIGAVPAFGVIAAPMGVSGAAPGGSAMLPRSNAQRVAAARLRKVAIISELLPLK